jgi:bla regulator protein BlaR1
MLCILYVNVVGMCLGFAATLTERVLPATFPRRWLWLAVITTSMVLPGYYRGHHNISVTDALEHPAVQAPLGQMPAVASLGAFNPRWWARTESYDTSINRVWLAISAVLLLWGLANMWRVSQLVSRSRRERGNPGRPGIVDGVPVVVTDSLGPATVGLWRSRVLVPRWVLALPRTQRQYVLRHEDEHRKAHDAHLLFATSLPLLLMPWNLALWWQLRRLYLAVEMDCDNRVVGALGDAAGYGELLLKVARASSHGPRLQPALLGGKGMLERRLAELLAPAPRQYIQRFLAAAAACALLSLALTMPHPVLSTGSHAHVTMTSGATTSPALQPQR